MSRPIEDEAAMHESELDWGSEEGSGEGAVWISCPYCGESVETVLDPESEGEMVQDCEVCCRPWLMRVERARDGRTIVRVDTL
jgi:hypothetical protein